MSLSGKEAECGQQLLGRRWGDINGRRGLVDQIVLPWSKCSSGSMKRILSRCMDVCYPETLWWEVVVEALFLYSMKTAVLVVPRLAHQNVGHDFRLCRRNSLYQLELIIVSFLQRQKTTWKVRQITN